MNNHSTTMTIRTLSTCVTCTIEQSFVRYMAKLRELANAETLLSSRIMMRRACQCVAIETGCVKEVYEIDSHRSLCLCDGL